MARKRNLKLNSNFWNQTPSVGALATIYQARILLPPFRILYREAMTPQLNFIERAVPNLPDGLRYQRELISRPLEAALVARVGELPFKEFEFHGFKGKRRWFRSGGNMNSPDAGACAKQATSLSFSGRCVRSFVIRPFWTREALQQVSVIEYGPGAGIGWHRDKPVFEMSLSSHSLRPACFASDGRSLTGATATELVGGAVTMRSIAGAIEPYRKRNLSGTTNTEPAAVATESSGSVAMRLVLGAIAPY